MLIFDDERVCMIFKEIKSTYLSTRKKSMLDFCKPIEKVEKVIYWNRLKATLCASLMGRLLGNIEYELVQ